eukprot:jgi/Mesvir1/1083/Mv17596-RA.1
MSYQVFIWFTLALLVGSSAAENRAFTLRQTDELVAYHRRMALELPSDLSPSCQAAILALIAGVTSLATTLNTKEKFLPICDNLPTINVTYHDEFYDCPTEHPYFCPCMRNITDFMDSEQFRILYDTFKTLSAALTPACGNFTFLADPDLNLNDDILTQFNFTRGCYIKSTDFRTAYDSCDALLPRITLNSVEKEEAVGLGGSGGSGGNDGNVAMRTAGGLLAGAISLVIAMLIL